MPALSGPLDLPHGATVVVKVMQSPEFVAALKKAKMAFATPVSVIGLLDTGASCSALDPIVVAGMQLQHRGVTEIHTPSTGMGVEHRNVYDATLALGEATDKPLTVTTSGIACHFADRGFLALIGRDLLQHCVLTYDGPTGRYRLEWPD